jgi:hypothetical protein
MTDERLREEQTAPDERLREEQTAPDERSGEEQITRAVDAVVLVGGQGTRLRPLTLSAPKPMLPTAGLPFLTHLLSRIAAAGIEHVVLGTSYKPHVFEAEFGDGSKLGAGNRIRHRSRTAGWRPSCATIP